MHIPFKLKIILTLLGIGLAIILLLYTLSYFKTVAADSTAMVVSVSSDGHYAVSSHLHGELVLWDLQHKTHQIIAKHANIYSAYFIKHTHDFLYQSNLDNQVFVKDIHGHLIRYFNPHFPSYGEVMTSDLKNYFASDVNYQIFKINKQTRQEMLYNYCGPAYSDPAPPAGKPYQCQDFLSSQKLFNLSLSKDDRYLLSSGFNSTYLWDVSTGKNLYHTNANNAKTVAIFNPDTQYIITADEATSGIIYNINQNKPFIDIYYATPNPPPSKYIPHKNDQQPELAIAIKFIDQKSMLGIFGRILAPLNYAVLFYPGQLKVKHSHRSTPLTAVKYLPLTNKHMSVSPVTDSFVRDQAIDTAPSAHILVMGQYQHNGIIVYKFNPKDKTLKMIWDPTLPSTLLAALHTRQS